MHLNSQQFESAVLQGSHLKIALLEETRYGNTPHEFNYIHDRWSWVIQKLLPALCWSQAKGPINVWLKRVKSKTSYALKFFKFKVRGVYIKVRIFLMSDGYVT